MLLFIPMIPQKALLFVLLTLCSYTAVAYTSHDLVTHDITSQPSIDVLGPFREIDIIADFPVKVIPNTSLHHVIVPELLRQQYGITLHMEGETLQLRSKSQYGRRAIFQRHLQSDLAYFEDDTATSKFSPIPYQHSATEVTIYGDNIHAITFQGLGELEILDLNTGLLDVTIKGAKRVTLQGRIGLNQLSISNVEQLTVSGLDSSSLSAEITGQSSVELRGITNATNIFVTGKSQLTLSKIDSADLVVKATDDSLLHIEGTTSLLQLALFDRAVFDGIELLTYHSYIKTHDQSVAQVYTVDSQYTLACDQSNIYYFYEPRYKTNIDTTTGSVLFLGRATNNYGRKISYLK